MANISQNSNGLDTPLMMLMGIDVQPGQQLSYEDAKLLWIYHPLAAKLVEQPVKLALSKKRTVTVDHALEKELVQAFEDNWEKLDCTNHIRDLMQISRVYGVGALAINAPDLPTDEPIDYWKLADYEDLYISVFDALNLAGSTVTNQNPNAPDFQRPKPQITAAGQPYHQSKTVTIFHGTPIYLNFQSSSFSFSGRSVFLRALYPLKSFIQSMMVDDLVSLKSGVLIAKLKQPGSIINNLMFQAAGGKRAILREAVTDNVISIDKEESIESIDLQNTNTAMTTARDNIISNIASGSDVPAKLLKDEAFTHGFGEGIEDSKQIVQFIDGIRNEMRPILSFFDRIVQHRAWNKDFFEAIKNEYPEEMGEMSYEEFFYQAKNNFKAEWPSLMEEPESEKVKVEETKLRGITTIAQTLLPMADPANRAKIMEWMEDNINQMKSTFKSEMILDIDELANYTPPTPVSPLTEPKPSEKA